MPVEMALVRELQLFDILFSIWLKFIICDWIDFTQNKSRKTLELSHHIKIVLYFAFISFLIDIFHF
jgi:hypothetical protein